jgi:hypothetical protein
MLLDNVFTSLETFLANHRHVLHSAGPCSSTIGQMPLYKKGIWRNNWQASMDTDAVYGHTIDGEMQSTASQIDSYLDRLLADRQ